MFESSSHEELRKRIDRADKHRQMFHTAAWQAYKETGSSKEMELFYEEQIRILKGE